ncbi:MAG: glycosyltransferase family 8 protein [Defluviitaleaceae bacterium]|nr:glycosyltransferase family 8 protein [Defluviitaleaceae bacterium]
MKLKQQIKKTNLGRILSKIKQSLLNNYKLFTKRKLRKYDGKPLTPEIQYEIQKILKNMKLFYLHDEKTAQNLSAGWNGVVNKPENLRFIENAIPVVLSANNSFSPYLAVMLQSLLDYSNPQRKYHFIIFERDFTDETKKHLQNQVSSFSHCSIDFVSTTNAFTGIPIIPRKKSHLSLDTFARLFIPYWLDEYPKVIYCDSDMLAKADIAGLFDIDIHDYCMGAVLNRSVVNILSNNEYSSLISTAAFSLLENWSRYIQAGLLVFDTAKFKNKISYQELFKFAIYYTNRYKKRKNDQDVISLLIKDDYFILPEEWNYIWSRAPKDIIPIHETYPNIKIIHYITNKKPWLDSGVEYNAADSFFYINYAKNIPLYNFKNNIQAL